MRANSLARAFDDLNKRIISCEKCPRLRAYCEGIAHKKKREFIRWDYWGKPVPGFGDIAGRLLVIGLAPAAHGANRTGRIFTGDSSGDWLVKALYETGFANQPRSVSKDDGLVLKDVYLTATVRCAPPKNRPTGEEISNCLPYLEEELRLLSNVKIVLTLGRIAFQTYLKLIRGSLSAGVKPKFKHGSVYDFGEKLPLLVCSMHPSRQNTQTGRLRWEDWIRVFKSIRRMLVQKRDGARIAA